MRGVPRTGFPQTWARLQLAGRCFDAGPAAAARPTGAQPPGPQPGCPGASTLPARRRLCPCPGSLSPGPWRVRGAAPDAAAQPQTPAPALLPAAQHAWPPAPPTGSREGPALSREAGAPENPEPGLRRIPPRHACPQGCQTLVSGHPGGPLAFPDCGPKRLGGPPSSSGGEALSLSFIHSFIQLSSECLDLPHIVTGSGEIPVIKKQSLLSWILILAKLNR